MTNVKVQGTVQLYRERLQIKISRIRNVVSADEVKLTDFIRSAPIGPDDLLQIINRTVDSIAEPMVRSIVNYCVDKVREKLSHYPAAKMHHHAYFAELVYHIVRMLEIGEFLCRPTVLELYVRLDSAFIFKVLRYTRHSTHVESCVSLTRSIE